MLSRLGWLAQLRLLADNANLVTLTLALALNPSSNWNHGFDSQAERRSCIKLQTHF